jgi:predicted phosphodiesterase
VKTCGEKVCAYRFREERYKEAFPNSKPGNGRGPQRRGRPVPPESLAPEPAPARVTVDPDAAPFPEADSSRWTLASPAPPAPTTGRYRRVLLWPDTHLPFQDDRAVALAFKVLDHVRPDLLITLGDIIDCAGFSRFATNTLDSRTHFQTELDTWEALATLMQAKTPNAERIYVIGNHEARIAKWLYGQPHLATMRAMNLGSSLSLANFGFNPEAREEVSLASGALTVTHGTRLGGSFAGLAARMEMATYGTSGVSGHTHRLCKYLQRDKAGLRVWIEAGHLALNPPHYAPKTQNWQQGVVIGEVSDSGNDFELEPVPFRLSYRCRIGNVELAA